MGNDTVVELKIIKKIFVVTIVLIVHNYSNDIIIKEKFVLGLYNCNVQSQ